MGGLGVGELLLQEAGLGRRRTLTSFGFLEWLPSSPGKLGGSCRPEMCISWEATCGSGKEMCGFWEEKCRSPKAGGDKPCAAFAQKGKGAECFTANKKTLPRSVCLAAAGSVTTAEGAALPAQCWAAAASVSRAPQGSLGIPRATKTDV